MRVFDVIVIGTGVSGQTAAGELAAAGKRVAVIDRRPFGGTCTLRGCEPKKVLYSAAEVAERARAHTGSGIEGRITVDWPSLIAFKRTFTDPASARIEGVLTAAGATAVHGVARFTAPDAVDVDGTAYAADNVVIATGALPIPLGVPGTELVLDSEGFMAAETLGERIVFIGGGYISFEFAHIAASAGAEVSILHRGPRVLSGFDPDLVDMLVEGYRRRGIDVRTDMPVVAVRRAGGALEVVAADGSTVACDMVVHGAGRAPVLDDLGLAAAEVAYGRQGVEVDPHMRSVSNPRVYAVGDSAALGAPLTPVGIAHARVALRNILEPGSAEFDGRITPSVAFTDPLLASVGLTESEAVARGLDVAVRFNDTSHWASSRRIGATVSGAKVVVERGTDRILGAHLLGRGAGEVVNVFAAAMRGGLTAGDLRSAIWAYPTASSDIVYLV